MGNCIFCKIAAGEIPAVKIYEDELVLAFLDIGPINFGHTLVIPKEHHESSSTIPEATAGRMFHIGSRIGIALRRELDYDAFNLHLADGTAAGQVVPHAHLHVVPRGRRRRFPLELAPAQLSGRTGRRNRREGGETAWKRTRK